ncbi:ankyrin repeat domain-containing protein [Streptomyces chilikensis]|uniref:ankyrin repeat domain-containing protein n=1 Tax=Streptomyces chilikensis TaxID=1194079 RepID=UPI000ADC8B55|nr:ankyrin repeat domain-containing protein [Streptomyces chilikensis]
MPNDLSPLHEAVELDNLPELHRLLLAGGDVHEEHHGITLLHAAVDGEMDAATQTGQPLHVDTTALLLAHGADPTRKSGGGTGVSAHHVAFVGGHWLACALFERWLLQQGDEELSDQS